MPSLLDQLFEQETKLKTLELQLADERVFSDTKKMRELNETYARIKEIVEVGQRYQKALNELEQAKETLAESTDKDLSQLAKDEIEKIEPTILTLEREFTRTLIPADPMDKKNIIVEIRAGAGGDEASLFAGELMRIYSRYAERTGWKVELISANRNDVGGFKEVIFSIKGNGAYSRLKYESGVHRVQRVPETEKQGRVHTSTATVAIMPEVEEVEVNIEPKDLKIETTTSTGAGGQSVNTTYSACRITHIPTNIMVYCQEERSQKQNKERALSIIRARVYALEQEKAQSQRDAQRRGQIGTGARSEKIRTYNFPQDRLTDHRIKQNWHNLLNIMDGDIDEIINALKEVETRELINAI